MTHDERHDQWDFSFHHGMSHGLTALEAAAHADELIGDRGVTVTEHPAWHVDIFTTTTGYVAHHETYEAATVGPRGIREGYITAACTGIRGIE